MENQNENPPKADQPRAGILSDEILKEDLDTEVGLDDLPVQCQACYRNEGGGYVTETSSFLYCSFGALFILNWCWRALSYLGGKIAR